MLSVQDSTVDFVIVDFAICDRQAFGNEALGLSRRYIGELNFPMTPGFTTQNCFLTQQTEKMQGPIRS